MVDGTMEASLHGELKEKEKQAFSTPAISLLSLYNTQCRASHGHFSFCSSHHCGLRINHTHLTRASSHSARNMVPCTSRITLCSFFASCSRDISALLCTLILCAATVILTLPAWPVSIVILPLRGCRDERATAKTEARGGGAQSYDLLLPVILYAFVFSYVLFQKLSC